MSTEAFQKVWHRNACSGTAIALSAANSGVKKFVGEITATRCSGSNTGANLLFSVRPAGCMEDDAAAYEREWGMRRRSEDDLLSPVIYLTNNIRQSKPAPSSCHIGR